MIRTLLDGIKKASVADHVRGALRMLLSWAVEHDRITGLPLFPKRRAGYVARERVLSDDELRGVWTVLNSGKFGDLADAFKLMLLTAQRRGEVIGMRWSELANEGTAEEPRWWWTLPAERTKNGKIHRVPRAVDAVALLDRLREETGELPVVFPSPKDENVSVANPQKAAERLWKKADVSEATLHDLRRTAAHRVSQAGVQGVVVGRVLNHSGAREEAAVTLTYLADPEGRRFDAVKRTALETWQADLRKVLTDVKG